MKIKNLLVFATLVIFSIQNTSAEEIQRSAYCTYENGECLLQGHNQLWWEKQYPGAWYRYMKGAQPTPQPSFGTLSEQPDISGFEQGVYNSPK